MSTFENAAVTAAIRASLRVVREGDPTPAEIEREYLDRPRRLVASGRIGPAFDGRVLAVVGPRGLRMVRP